MKKATNWDKLILLQQNIADCGVVSLAMICNYYGKDYSLEEMRKSSGTTSTGTSLLGLKQAAEKLGLSAEGYEASSIEDLKSVEQPSILHLVVDNKLLHYVVFFGYRDGVFSIGDPAKGHQKVSESKLDELWQSKRILVVKDVGDNQSQVKLSRKRYKFGRQIEEIFEDNAPIIILSVVLGMILAILSLATAFFFSYLIDSVLPQQIYSKVVVSCFALGLTLLVHNILSYVRQGMIINQGKKINEKIGANFIVKLLRLPKYFFDSRRVGDLIVRMNDIVKIQTGVTHVLGLTIVDLILVLIICTGLILLNPILGIAITAVSCIFITAIIIYSRSLISLQRGLMEAYGSNESLYIDVIQGIEAIKSSSKEDLFSRMSFAAFSAFQSKWQHFSHRKNKISFASGVYGTIVTVLTVTWCATLLFNTDIKLGEMVATIQLILIMAPSAVEIGLSNIYLHEANAAFGRISELNEVDVEYDKQFDSSKTQIKAFESLQVENLNFAFAGQTELLTNVSFEIIKGQLICLKGGSGSGKTTMINILQKFYPIADENIFLNKTEWNSLSVQSLRSLLAVVPQEVKIFSGSVASNITMTEIVNEKVFTETLKFYGLDGLMGIFPNSVNTIVGELGQPISGGQKQLIGISRALFNHPQLLLLDEATSAMDNKLEKDILTLLMRLVKEKQVGILFATHDDEICNLAHKTYEIS